jgi:hypothetical protein
MKSFNLNETSVLSILLAGASLSLSACNLMEENTQSASEATITPTSAVTSIITELPTATEAPTSAVTSSITELPTTTKAPASTATSSITEMPTATVTPTSATSSITELPTATEAPTSTATSSITEMPTATQAPTLVATSTVSITPTSVMTSTVIPTLPEITAVKTAWTLTVGVNEVCNDQQRDCTLATINDEPLVLALFTAESSNEYQITLNQKTLAGEVSDVFSGSEIKHPNWKYDRIGAYSIQFDDWCGHSTHGIYDRGLKDFKALGIVGSIGINTSGCTDLEWQQAQEFLNAGFSIFNHGAEHKYPDVPTWENPDSIVITWDNDEQLGDSNDLIAEKLNGYRPEIVATPNDIMTTDIINYIKEHPDFIGARAPNFIDQTWVPSSGVNRRQNVKPCPQGSVCTNHFEPMDPYFLKNDLYGPYSSFSGNSLVEYLNYAVQYEGWALQYTHGIDDESWESITLAHWEAFIIRLEAAIEEQKLWIATPETIVRYHHATLNCLTLGDQNIPYGWLYKIDDSNEFCERHKTEITAQLNMPEDISAVYQDGTAIEFYYSKPEALAEGDIRQVYFEYMPNAGDIVILK